MLLACKICVLKQKCTFGNEECISIEYLMMTQRLLYAQSQIRNFILLEQAHFPYIVLLK